MNSETRIHVKNTSAHQSPNVPRHKKDTSTRNSNARGKEHDIANCKGRERTTEGKTQITCGKCTAKQENHNDGTRDKGTNRKHTDTDTKQTINRDIDKRQRDNNDRQESERQRQIDRHYVVVRHGLLSNVMLCKSMIWNHMIWYGMAWNISTLPEPWRSTAARASRQRAVVALFAAVRHWRVQHASCRPPEVLSKVTKKKMNTLGGKGLVLLLNG